LGKMIHEEELSGRLGISGPTKSGVMHGWAALRRKGPGLGKNKGGS